MVAFAPTVPNPNIAATADPEYTSYRWSRPIGPFEGNKANEIALKGAGEALDKGVDAADSLVRHHIEQGIQEEGGAKVQELQTSLENTLAAVRGDGRTAYAEADGPAKLSLLTQPPKGEDVPKGVKDVGPILDRMAERRANGSITETKFRGDVDALAKQWRAAWPGYVKDIDGEFDRVTQRGVASAYIQSMVRDLDVAQSAMKERRSKVEGLLQHAEEVDHITGADQWHMWYLNGTKSEAEVRHWYNTTMSNEYALKQKKDEVEMSDLKDKQSLKSAEDYFNHVGSNTIKNVFYTLDAAMQPDKVAQEVREGKIDGQHAELTATHLQSVVEQARSAAMKEAMETKGKDGKTIFEAMGPDKLKDLIDKNPYIQYTQGVINLLTGSKDHSVAMLAANAGAAQIKDDEYKLQNQDDPVGRLYRGLKVWGNTGGVGGKLVADQLESGFSIPALRTWMNNSLIMGGAQPDKDKGELFTMKKAYDEALANGKSNPAGFKLFAEKVGERIADPNTPLQLKAGYMEQAYDSENLALMEQLARDHVDSQTGKKIPGRVWFYQNLTQAGQADEVARVAKLTNHPELWKKYQDYVEKAGEYIIGSQFAEPSGLSEAAKATGAAIGSQVSRFFTPTDPSELFQYSYDNEHKKFTVSLPSNIPTQYKRDSGKFNQIFKEAQDGVDKVNTVLKSVENMAKYSGTDTDTYIHNLLTNMSPSDPRIARMLAAIRATAPQKEEEPKK